jgi:predicted nucleic acid-binding protein
MVVSDLTRLECRLHPISVGDAALLAQFDAFFTSADVQVAALTAQVYDRATLIRAKHRYRTPDALHLAAALESGCGVFLTNDGRLAGFPDLKIQALP